MGISFGSIQTGLPKDIVQQIVKADRIPINQMQDRIKKVESKQGLVDELIKLVNETKTIIETTKSPDSLRELKVITDEGVLDITLDKKMAKPGFYSFMVNETAQKSSAITTPFESKSDSYIGVGYIRYELPSGESKDIYIDSDNSSLEKIANLINNDPQININATVVNDGTGSDTPWRLILSLKDTGDDSVATFPYFYFVDGEADLDIEATRDAKDAKIMLDGFELEHKTNKLDNLIPGATINLKKAKPGEEISIEIVEDRKAIEEKITNLIDKINNILTFIQKQNTLDSKSDTSRTLGGDLVLQTLESRIRSTIFTPIQTYKGEGRANQIGITFEKDGLLKFDLKKFEALLNSDYEFVAEVLTGFSDQKGKRFFGLINKFDDIFSQSVRFPDGILQGRKTTLKSNIKRINEQIQTRERSLEEKEKNLKNRFARLEETISRLKGQSAGLASLAGGSQGNSIAPNLG